MQDRVGNSTVLSLTASRRKQRGRDFIARSDGANIEFRCTKFAYLVSSKIARR